MIRQVNAKQKDKEQASIPLQHFMPVLVMGMMMCSLFLLDAVLSLQYLRFNDALLTRLGSWPLIPVHILFPHFEVLHSYMDKKVPLSLAVDRGWKETALLFGALSALFLGYIVGLRYLVRLVSLRYILISTALLGMLCVVFASFLSGDVFSYIAYARMNVIYHINPLLNAPWFIGKDGVYTYVSWVAQPSIYGPTWIFMTSGIQWLLLQCGLSDLVPMILSLRLLELAMHLGSVALVWSISGLLQQCNSFVSTEKRVFATLAFAWNPLLLLEASVNGHIDSTVLFFVLLALLFLLKSITAKRPSLSLLVVGVLFALAACLKLNIALFVPGLLLYLWFQRERIRKILTFMGAFLAAMVVLYAPSWQGGALLQTIKGTPAVTRNLNTPADFFGHLFNGIVYRFVHPTTAIYIYENGYMISSAERVTHMLSLGLFALIFVYMCWWAIRVPERINNVPGLIRWFALLWLVYSMLGSPWFWPWYLVTFFGLFALVEASTNRQTWFAGPFPLPITVRLLTFSTLTLYCFFTFAPANTFVPGLYHFYWSDFRGLYIWFIPVVGLLLSLRYRQASSAITHKLAATHWQNMRTFLGRGI